VHLVGFLFIVVIADTRNNEPEKKELGSTRLAEKLDWKKLKINGHRLNNYTLSTIMSEFKDKFRFLFVSFRVLHKTHF
jgi:hypothetical protein